MLCQLRGAVDTSVEDAGFAWLPVVVGRCRYVEFDVAIETYVFSMDVSILSLLGLSFVGTGVWAILRARKGDSYGEPDFLLVLGHLNGARSSHRRNSALNRQYVIIKLSAMITIIHMLHAPMPRTHSGAITSSRCDGAGESHALIRQRRRLAWVDADEGAGRTRVKALRRAGGDRMSDALDAWSNGQYQRATAAAPTACEFLAKATLWQQTPR